jgi:hypothetical protein
LWWSGSSAGDELLTVSTNERGSPVGREARVRELGYPMRPVSYLKGGQVACARRGEARQRDG